MPPIAPAAPAESWLSSFDGISVMIHSVVIIMLATDAAFCNVVRVTLAGPKIIKALISSYTDIAVLRLKLPSLSYTLLTIADTSLPASIPI